MSTGADRRYEIVPQMRHYDALGPTWKPYVMFANQPNFQSPVCTTDGHGFRTTFDAEGRRLDVEHVESPPRRTGLVVGGSTAFGVGASSDTFALPSVLNRRSATTWLNFGCRAYNATQEWINVALHSDLLRRIDQIVLLTGTNTLELALLTGDEGGRFAPFFGQTELFGSADADQPHGRVTPRRVVERLRRPQRRGIHDDIEAFQFSRRTVVAVGLRDTSRLLDAYRRVLQLWSALAAAYDFELTFVLQPLATWIPKRLTAQERELFDILDNHPANHWAPLAHLAAALSPSIRDGLRAAAQDLEIRFLDLNDHLDDERWLFVDRVHMTDEGYVEIAKILQAAGVVDDRAA